MTDEGSDSMADEGSYSMGNCGWQQLGTAARELLVPFGSDMGQG